MKWIPNILTSCRFMIAFTLLFSTENTGVFVGSYLVCGCTDALDGYFARKYHAETKLGAKLDSLADFTLFCIVFIAMIFIMKFKVDMRRLSCVFAVAFLKLINFAITRVKFKEWNIMHTIGHKIAGLLLFLSVPVFVIQGEFRFSTLLGLAIIMTIPALEEMAILLTAKEYNANQKSLFSRKQTQLEGN